MELDLNKYWAKPNKTIEQHNQELLLVVEWLYTLGYVKDEKIYRLLQVACKYHDYGKVNSHFVERVKSKDKKVPYDPSKEVGHNILSVYFIDPEHEAFECDFTEYIRVMHAVLNHHAYVNNLQELQERKGLSETLLAEFETFRIKKSVMQRLSLIIEEPKSILLKGLLHKCDYSASGGYQAEFPNNFLKQSLDEMMSKWKREDSAKSWNDLQKFCGDNQAQNIMVTAQTGMGKTEAGLRWIGNEKGYFILPLRTAINAIYKRIKENVLCGKKLDSRLALLHSDALQYYTGNVQGEVENVYEYYQKGKQLSLPLTISTLDQLFDFVFKYNGYELKLATLSYSKIVIDEIQMYEAELLAYLVVGIEKIHEMGGKIAILTATLSPFVKDCLKTIPFMEATFVNDIERHNIKVIDDFINVEDTWRKYKENKEQKKGNKVLVVCNTIQMAQKVYEGLLDMVGMDEKDELNIFHSRFIQKERREKEAEILEFGKTCNDKGELDLKSGIWIATSLVEASLDIDFDYLFTELFDLNSLFQRLGRCNRKGMKSVLAHNCFVYCKIEPKLLKSKDNPKGFVDEVIFQLSKEAIFSVEGVVSEHKKVELIEEFLTVEKLKGSMYEREYRQKYDEIKQILPYKFEKDENKLRNILSQTIIPSPVFEQQEYKEEIRTCEVLLQQKNLSPIEKVMYKEAIMQYTVDVPYYEYLTYVRAKKKNKAETYPEIEVDDWEKIPVIECRYGDLGFQKMLYDEGLREPNIW